MNNTQNTKGTYIPTDLEIKDVSSQIDYTISRDIIIDTLIKTNGDVTDAILTILTDNNILFKDIIMDNNILFKDIN
jgi:NACalpha-BTF3-like transcription factor